jgi:uncharacterized protein GlcG (DUF336 family)
MKKLDRCATALAGCALLVTLNSGAAQPGPPAPLATTDLISLADATRMARAALEECAKRGQPTTALVVDANGFERVALSDDNAKLIGVVHTRRKAATVLQFKVSSQALQTRAASDKAFADQYGKDERYLLQGGGLPIYRDGKLVAVISVGGSGDVNDACAQAGVKAVSWATMEPAARP